MIVYFCKTNKKTENFNKNMIMKNQLLISFLLTVLLSMTGIKAYAHDIEVANAQGKTIYYVWTNNNTELAVSFQGEYFDPYSNEYSGDIVIPESVTYNGTTYSVTSIGYYAFYYCTGLISVTIPNSVTSIGSYAFQGCTGLTSVIIPNSVTIIDYAAFFECSSLTSVTIPNSVTYISNYAFCGCESFTFVTIPNSVTDIESGVFMGCSGLTSVTIPNSVTSIGISAFSNCSGLTSVTIPNSVTKIGDKAFYKCSDLFSVTIQCSPTNIGNNIFDGCNYIKEAVFDCETITPLLSSIESLKKITINESVTKIGDKAFWCCSGLTSVTIPNSVTSIGNSAFSYCSGLNSVIIPKSVTSIGEQAFYKCSGLTSLIVKRATPLTIYYSNTFYDCYFATLYVPAGSKAKYEAAKYWKNFRVIDVLKCAKPTIKIDGRELTFESETEGVTFQWSYSYNGDNDNIVGNKMNLAGTTNCHVTVYATKEDFEDSDVATADVVLCVGKKGDVNADGKVTITDAVSVVNIILNNGDATAPALESPEDEAPEVGEPE